MSSFSFIMPKNQLWKDAKVQKAHDMIVEHISNLPSNIRSTEHKFSMELLTMITCMVEHKINNQGKKDKLKIDKKSVVIQVYNSLYGTLKPDDLQIISKNIEYLHDNNQIVKYPLWTVAKASIVGWLKKKLL
jgi:hypothetical protein